MIAAPNPTGGSKDNDLEQPIDGWYTKVLESNKNGPILEENSLIVDNTLHRTNNWIEKTQNQNNIQADQDNLCELEEIVDGLTVEYTHDLESNHNSPRDNNLTEKPFVSLDPIFRDFYDNIDNSTSLSDLRATDRVRAPYKCSICGKAKRDCGHGKKSPRLSKSPSLVKASLTKSPRGRKWLPRFVRCISSDSTDDDFFTPIASLKGKRDRKSVKMYPDEDELNDITYRDGEEGEEGEESEEGKEGKEGEDGEENEEGEEGQDYEEGEEGEEGEDYEEQTQSVTKKSKERKRKISMYTSDFDNKIMNHKTYISLVARLYEF